jgi:thiosulfate/3-mercaptopyruvate sulfurtransferase
MTDIAGRGYARPEVLVSTDWVAAHAGDPSIRLIESNEDALVYASGHIPGAVHVDWTNDLNDHVRRDYIDRKSFASLMSTATRTTGGRATPSGCFSCLDTPTRASWTADG